MNSGKGGLGSGNRVVMAPTLDPSMHPFATYVLRSYYKATGWNEDNLYANFTRSSNGTSSSYFDSRPNDDVQQLFSTFPSPVDCTFPYQNPPTRYSRRRIR